MLKSTNSRFLMGVGGLVVAAMVGCAGEISRPPASQLQEGLNLLDTKDPNWGLNGAYVKGGRVIYMETRVGPPRPEIYRQDAPDDPANEMDMRFVDAKGRTFWAQRGGDTYVDPTWNDEIKHSIDPTLSKDERMQDWDMASEASQAMMKANLPTFKDHMFHFAAFAAHPTPMRDVEAIKNLETFQVKAPRPATIPKEIVERDRAYGAYNDSTWTQMYTAKYSGSTGCFAWICVARHSATIMYVNPNVGYWQQAIYANNHGRGPYDSGMGYDCYSWNGGAWYQYGVLISGSTAGGADGNYDGQGGCQTAYNWDSGGTDHLCNDDAAYELWQGKGGGYTGWSWSGYYDNLDFAWNNGYTDSSGWHPKYNFACNCGSFYGCSGDWNTPSCP
jgi:hypothetical protein